jgi:hypothetical protein
MADNFQIKDAAAANKTVRTVDIGSDTHLPIAASDAFEIVVTFTRPADTTAYAIGDHVTNSTTVPVALAFTNFANRNGGYATIMSATIYSSRATNSALLDLELFNGAAAPTATNDNAAYNPSDADRDDVAGIINFPIANLIAGSSNKIWVATTPVGLQIKCDAATSTIWGFIRMGTAYTPDSAEVFTVTLSVVRD